MLTMDGAYLRVKVSKESSLISIVSKSSGSPVVIYMLKRAEVNDDRSR